MREKLWGCGDAFSVSETISRFDINKQKSISSVIESRKRLSNYHSCATLMLTSSYLTEFTKFKLV